MLEVVAINDSGGVKQASHLVKYDSVLGTSKLRRQDRRGRRRHVCRWQEHPNRLLQRPKQLPWKELGIDIVIEGTGVFIDTPGASKHLDAGAKEEGCHHCRRAYDILTTLWA